MNGNHCQWNDFLLSAKWLQNGLKNFIIKVIEGQDNNRLCDIRETTENL